MANWLAFANKLRALPQKRFCAFAYQDGSTYCVVGAFVPEYIGALDGNAGIGRPRFVNPYEIIEGEGGNTALQGSEAEDEAQYLLHKLLKKRTGLERYELDRVQVINDKYPGGPPERYHHVLDAVLKLAKET
jgi:hypothetical protein